MLKPPSRSAMSLSKHRKSSTPTSPCILLPHGCLASARGIETKHRQPRWSRRSVRQECLAGCNRAVSSGWSPIVDVAHLSELCSEANRDARRAPSHSWVDPSAGVRVCRCWSSQRRGLRCHWILHMWNRQNTCIRDGVGVDWVWSRHTLSPLDEAPRAEERKVGRTVPACRIVFTCQWPVTLLRGSCSLLCSLF